MENIDFSKIPPRERLSWYFVGYPPEKILTPDSVEEAIARTRVILRAFELELESYDQKGFCQSNIDLAGSIRRMIYDEKETLSTIQHALEAYVADKTKVAESEENVYASFIGRMLTIPVPIQFQMSLLETLVGILEQ